MSDLSTASTEPGAAATEKATPLPPFTPAPIPKSGYAEPEKAHRKVSLKFPVIFEGKTWDAIYLRRLTVAQVAIIVDNAVEMHKRDDTAGLAFPIYVDAEENEIPSGLVGLLPDEEWQAIQDLGRDCIPQRYRPPPIEESQNENSNGSSPTTGDTTEPS